MRVNAMDVLVNVEAFAEDAAPGRAERVLSWPRRSWDRLTGDTPPCPSAVALNFMAGIEGLPNSEGYCLAEGDEDTGLLLVPGERDYRGRCTVSVCQRVNMAADDTIAITNRMAVRLYEPPDPDSEIMAHASGAMILTMGQAALQSVIDDYGMAALETVLATPEAMAATALSVMAVGGTLWLCNR